MEGLFLIGTFGATMVGLGLLENAGLEINSTLLSFVMESAKFGGILYIIKLASTLFL